MGRRREPVASSSSDPPKKIARLTVELNIPKLESTYGTVLACGQGDMGQLGLGEDEMERKRPSVVGDLKNIVDIRAGGMHSLLLTAEGKLYSFGCNDEGALGRDTSEEGSEFIPREVDLPGKCVRISAGDSHSACLLQDGRVFAWGSFRDSHGSMGLTLEGNKRLPIEVFPGIPSCSIASGADHLVILTCWGKVYTMGCGEQGQLGRVSLRNASGESRRGKTELLKPSLVYMKGCNFANEIWATTYCTFVRERKTSKIFAFGLNNYNQLALKTIGAPIIAPSVTLLEDVKTISGGQHHTLVLSNENICYVIGRKDYGRLGLGQISNDVEKLTPIKALKNVRIVDVSCGECQSFAVTEDGQVYAWGMGSNLQLGTGSEDDEWEPVHIVSKQTKDSHITKVSSGGQHTLFLSKSKADNLLVEENKSTLKDKNETNMQQIASDKIANTMGTKEHDAIVEKVVEETEKVNGVSKENVTSDIQIQSKVVSTTKRGRKK